MDIGNHYRPVLFSIHYLFHIKNFTSRPEGPTAMPAGNPSVDVQDVKLVIFLECNTEFEAGIIYSVHIIVAALI